MRGLTTLWIRPLSGYYSGKHNIRSPLYLGDGEDEASHERAHNSVMDRLRFSGWRLERNCGPVDEGRVIMVQPGQDSFSLFPYLSSLSALF